MSSDPKDKNARNSEAVAQYLATMSHEVRTPLTAMLGYADLMLEEEISLAERERAVNAILRNGNHLLTLVNSILDISKIEAGKLEVESMSCNPMEIMSDVAALLKLKAFEKNITFTLEVRYPFPKCIISDPTRIKQIMLNLLGNAIKFTDSGGVRLIASYSPTHKQLIFEVLDSGPGMDEEQRARLFQAFTQADASISRRFGGTGLGLVISKHLIELLGGSIQVESESERGSKFTFSIASGDLKDEDLEDLAPSLEATIIEQCKALDIPQLIGRVLVVDDVADNRDLLRHILEKTGAQVEMAENGKIGTTKALAQTYDLILLDMEMPVMTGLEAVKYLRTNKYRAPIVALTGNAQKETAELCLKEGFDDFMSKPFKRERLLELVSLYLRRATPNEVSPLRPILSDDYLDYAKIVLKFVDGLPEKVETINRSIRAKDWLTVKSIAHRLIGAETFGYPDLTRVARQLEKVVLDNLTHEALRGTEELALICARIIAARDYVATLVHSDSVVAVQHEVNPSPARA